MAHSTTHDATGAVPVDPAHLRADVQANDEANGRAFDVHGVPSVPSRTDPQQRRPGRPILVGAAGDVGFLDAPGVDANALFDTIDDVLADMPVEAILTVYSDDPTCPEVVAAWCAGRGVELLAIIRHAHEDTTLTLRRADPPA